MFLSLKLIGVLMKKLINDMSLTMLMDEESLIEAVVRGFSKPIILWLIFLKPMHGYDLMLEFKHVTGKGLKPGMVYPFLNSLEKKGYVAGTWIKNGKSKRETKSYRLTAKGKRLLTSFNKHFSTPLKDILLELTGKKGKIEES